MTRFLWGSLGTPSLVNGTLVFAKDLVKLRHCSQVHIGGAFFGLAVEPIIEHPLAKQLIQSRKLISHQLLGNHGTNLCDGKSPSPCNPGHLLDFGSTTGLPQASWQSFKITNNALCAKDQAGSVFLILSDHSSPIRSGANPTRMR